MPGNETTVHEDLLLGSGENKSQKNKRLNMRTETYNRQRFAASLKTILLPQNLILKLNFINHKTVFGTPNPIFLVGILARLCYSRQEKAVVEAKRCRQVIETFSSVANAIFKQYGS